MEPRLQYYNDRTGTLGFRGLGGGLKVQGVGSTKPIGPGLQDLGV